MFLLDTNLVSEVTRIRRDPGVESWLSSAHPELMFISAITLTELRFGIARLADGRRRDALLRWYEMDIPVQFSGRILDVTFAVADRAGTLKAAGQAAGLITDDFDCLIAATAAVHGATVVTRNTRHFGPLGVSVLNPWTSQA